MLKQKIKKSLKLGALILASSIPLVANMSMTTAVSKEYISIKIDGDPMTFQNISEATNYVMRNNVDAKRQIKIGEPKYLNKNTGLIDSSSLYEYKADGNSMTPAYKMMNGKYTRSRDRALKSYLGRSHLVAQYYDGIDFHDGNSIGLKQAKDAILSRQLEEVVPYYDVDLGSSSVRINPFNKDDVHYLQDEALKVYKNSNINQAKDDENTHVTTSYLLPTKDGKEILVLPQHASKGLQVSDLFQGESISSLFKEWVKSKITFDITVTLNNPDSPYWFKNISDNSKDPSQNFGFAVKPFGSGHNFPSGGKLAKSMWFKDVPFNIFAENKETILHFLNHRRFWGDNSFKQEGCSGNNPGSYDWSTWARNKGENNFFGAAIQIINIDPWRHGIKKGFDVSINNTEGNTGSYQAFYTQETIVRKIKNKEITQKNFKNFVKDNSYSISPNLFNKVLEKFGDIINNKETQNYFSNNKTTALNSDSGELMGKNQNEDTSNVSKFTGLTDTEDSSLWNLNKESKQDDLSQKNSSVTNTNLINYLEKQNFKKILILNNTPIAQIKDGKIVDRKIYKNFKNSKSTQYLDYDSKDSYWECITPKGDFVKTINFNRGVHQKTSITIGSDDFGSIKGNPTYSKKVPLLMFEKETNNYKGMTAAKILTDSYGVKSVHNIDHSSFFNSNIDIKHRKEEINEDFFEPALVYVIYNDNDEIIDEFQTTNKNLRFDDAQAITNNAQAILTEYLRKDTSAVFIRDKDGEWMDQPISNKVISVYNIRWNNKYYTFKHFENIKSFIEKWVRTNATTIVLKG